MTGRKIAAFAVAAATLACGGEDARVGRPLLDPGHAPDVLVEAGRLAPRPTLAGNRFVAGWRPWRGRPRRGGPPVLSAAAAGARLEIVQLAPRARTLALDLEDGTFDAGGRVAVRAAGRDLGTVAAADPLAIPLPPDLPGGRVLVELAPAGTRLVVREGRVRPALPAGEVLVEGGEVVQSGDSRVDFVRRTAGRRTGAGESLVDESLVGRFTPPAGARPGQRFELRLEHPDGRAAAAFAWTPSLLARLRGARRFEVPLGAAGFTRVSLVARGAGPPGRWSDLALVRPAAASPERDAPEPAPREPPEIVLLYVMDALRADAVGHLGGGDGVTPTWDRLAGEGLTFRAHHSVAPNTLPSTKALLTGEAYADRGGWKLAAGVATLAEAYRSAGYRTALFSGNVWVGPAYGVDRGFEHVVEVTLDERRAAYNDNAERLHEAALAWLASLPAGARAFMYVHAVHPHNPYDPPDPWRSDFTAGVPSSVDGSTATLLAVQRRRKELDAAGRERLRRLYAAGLAYADAHLGRLLAALERRVGRRRLLVALTSDHGEELFDHGGVLHGYTLYEEMIRIPLVLWGPGRVPAGAHTGLTSTLDLHATLARLVAPDAASEGRPLLPRPPEGDVHLAAAASVKGGIYSIRSARWKLVWAPRRGLDWGLGGGLGRSRSAEYLFDLEADPRERVNRAGEGGLEAAWLRSRLRAWIAAKTAHETAAEETEVDDETRRRLEALGYVD